MASLQIEIFLLLLTGYIMGKRGMLNKNTREQLTDMVVYIILSCSILKSFQMELSGEILKAAVSAHGIRQDHRRFGNLQHGIMPGGHRQYLKRLRAKGNVQHKGSLVQPVPPAPHTDYGDGDAEAHPAGRLKPPCVRPVIRYAGADYDGHTGTEI